MTNDELLILVTGGTNHTMAEEHLLYRKALFTVLELCATPDEVTIGDKGLFNSGRNSMREEIKQAIEKELR